MPAAKPWITRARVLYVLLAILFAVAVIYRVRDTTDRVDELLRGDALVRLPVDVDLPTFTVTEITPEAEAAGLRTGDRIVAVNGAPLTTVNVLFRPLMASRPGDRLRLRVESAASPAPVQRDVTIELQPIRRGPPRVFDVVSFVVANLALPYLCLALGFWVAAARVRDRLAWLVLLLLLSLAEFVGGDWRSLFGREDWFQPIAVVYQPLLANLWPISMLLFGLYFPERLPLDRRLPWLKWIVIAPVLFRVTVTNLTIDFMLVNDIGTAIAVDRIFRPMLPVVVALHFIAIACFFVAMWYRIRTERRPDARRRLALLQIGATIALTPLCIVVLLLVSGALSPFPEWLLLPVLAMLFVFPATMAHVIVVHRAMDVRLVIRQGVQYLLARGTIRAIQLAISAAIIVAAALRLGPFGSDDAATQVLMVGGSLIVILLIRRFADRVSLWVDRRFFREAYDAEQILAELAGKVRSLVEMRPLLETVAHQISAALHVPRLAILLNGGATLEPAYALGYSQVPRVPLSNSARWDETEPSLRSALDAELVLPLSSNQKLVGVMSLGPKQSEEPFTSNDLRLLDAVAAQTGLAIENSRLTAEIAAEIAAREKAKRELEIAHEVQERLFPQEYPPVPGIEYAGACRPALGVGGDYYDFVPLGPMELGIAIGDVSGKGMPAALLMATLRAYLRGQTVGGGQDLPVLMANLNQLVYESSAPNRYATFFYAQYDGASGVLRYVNAGHNAPMLLRASGEIERLDVGGPVIGLMLGLSYEEGTTRMQPGDMLVAFTDGVSEAMNGEMQDWGEDHLADAVRRHATCAPAQVIARIIESADCFAAGAPQHDDMTVVVVKRV